MNAEEKKALIEHIESDLELWRNVTLKYCHEVEREDVLRDIKVNEIALAALTAQPVKLPNPQAYFTWHYGGNAPDDFYEDVQISRHHDEKSVDGTDRYPVYSQHEVIAAIRAAGYEVAD